jgi:hypothetical protein
MQEANRRFGWKRVRVTYSEFANGTWNVTLSRLPEIAGRFLVFRVSAEGAIIDWKGGS